MKLDEMVPNGWRDAIASRYPIATLERIDDYLEQRKQDGKRIYPPRPLIFKALELTPPDNVRVVILGQDPYHRQGQAQGLAFSVPADVPPPPSLVNIATELNDDLQIRLRNGNLESWAKQGVLLLNAALTVEEGAPMIHQKIGWHAFTQAIIDSVAASSQPTVFILWGNEAQKRGRTINEQRHLVIRSVHPSPLSATRGFFGSKPFSRANAYLLEHGRGAVNWSN